jgi:hypothetical protein
MGRDPVELDTLCKNGFAQASALSRGGSRTEVLIPAGGAIALLFSRMGRDYPVEQMLDTLCKNGFAQLLRYRAGQSNRGSHPAHKFGWAGIRTLGTAVSSVRSAVPLNIKVDEHPRTYMNNTT